MKAATTAIVINTIPQNILCTFMMSRNARNTMMAATTAYPTLDAVTLIGSSIWANDNT